MKNALILLYFSRIIKLVVDIKLRFASKMKKQIYLIYYRYTYIVTYINFYDFYIIRIAPPEFFDTYKL